MRSAPDRSCNKSRTPGSAPSHHWYTTIEVACQIFRHTLVDWRKCNEDLDCGSRNSLVETNLPNQIARPNRMHGGICGIYDLIDDVDGIDLFFKYRQFWRLLKMRL